MEHTITLYIVTNKYRKVIYIGVTNDLAVRLWQHKEDSFNNRSKTFAGRYKCINLIYYEHYDYIQDAIDREKEIKGWNRKKKELLIESTNPKWRFLNDEIEE